jgi:hypothetical protein
MNDRELTQIVQNHTGYPWFNGKAYAEYHGIDVDQARIAELKGALLTARNNALQEAANACCHPTNAHNGGESAICRNRVLALSKAALGDGA